MNILALDVATKCGWALREFGTITSGVQDFKEKRGESSGMRYVRFSRWLREIGAKADLIVYEQPHMRGGHATEVLGAMLGLVLTYCAERGINYVAVHSGTLKKATAGSGNADKAAMIAAVRAKWDATVTDDNEADALALLHFSLKEIL